MRTNFSRNLNGWPTYAVWAWEEIVLWHLLPYWGISQAWWKDAKRVEHG